jgi:hypothetical protein
MGVYNWVSSAAPSLLSWLRKTLLNSKTPIPDEGMGVLFG